MFKLCCFPSWHVGYPQCVLGGICMLVISSRISNLYYLNKNWEEKARVLMSISTSFYLLTQVPADSLPASGLCQRSTAWSKWIK